MRETAQGEQLDAAFSRATVRIHSEATRHCSRKKCQELGSGALLRSKNRLGVLSLCSKKHSAAYVGARENLIKNASIQYAPLFCCPSLKGEHALFYGLPIWINLQLVDNRGKICGECLTHKTKIFVMYNFSLKTLTNKSCRETELLKHKRRIMGKTEIHREGHTDGWKRVKLKCIPRVK